MEPESRFVNEQDGRRDRQTATKPRWSKGGGGGGACGKGRIKGGAAITTITDSAEILGTLGAGEEELPVSVLKS